MHGLHGGKIHFSALRDHGKYARAGLFDFDRIPVKCDEGNDKAFISTSNAVDVSNRKFEYQFGFSDLAPGDTDSTNCTTTGPREWTAHKQPSIP